MAELARAYSVSAITVHRDLEQLAAEGLVERVHGGAQALVPPAELAAPAIATAWSQRVGQASAAKGRRSPSGGGAGHSGFDRLPRLLVQRAGAGPAADGRPAQRADARDQLAAIAYEMQAEPVHVVVARASSTST